MTQRQNELLELLLHRGRLSVEELTSQFRVTGMTIRRDLDALEEQGLLTRTHGGCVLRTPHVREQPYREKEQQNLEAKEAIARALVSRLPDGVSLYLDTGTTCTMVARLLRSHRRDLQVFTNNLPAALDLFGAEEIKVIIPGGMLGRRSPDLTGEFSLIRLNDCRFDYAVIGGDALDLTTGELYSADLATAALSRVAQQRADQTFAGIDSSKLDRRSLSVTGRLRDGVTLFTDGHIPVSKTNSLRKLGVEVVRVGKGRRQSQQEKS